MTAKNSGFTGLEINLVGLVTEECLHRRFDLRKKFIRKSPNSLSSYQL